MTTSETDQPPPAEEGEVADVAPATPPRRSRAKAAAKPPEDIAATVAEAEAPVPDPPVAEATPPAEAGPPTEKKAGSKKGRKAKQTKKAKKAKGKKGKKAKARKGRKDKGRKGKR